MTEKQLVLSLIYRYVHTFLWLNVLVRLHKVPFEGCFSQSLLLRKANQQITQAAPI